MSAYDAALVDLSVTVDDLVEAVRRRALDEAGVDRELEDLILLDLLGRGWS